MHNKLIQLAMLLFLTALVQACGGGNEEKGTPEVAVRLEQAIKFTQPGQVTKTFGDAAFLNSVTSYSGTGKISYSSSAPNIAQISSEGQISILKAGSSTISAHIAEDAQYKSASATFELVINKAGLTFQFQNTGTVALIAEQTFTNPVSPQIENIVYESDDTEIASIDSAGIVTAKRAGEVIIRATIPETENYLSASSDFIASIAPRKVSLNLLIGRDDTLISANTDVQVQLKETSQVNCDFSNITDCNNGQIIALSNTPHTSSAITSTASGYLALQHGDKQGDISLISSLQPPLQSSHKAISFKGYIWIFGGYSTEGLTNNIWRSRDGDNWELVAQSASFSPRSPVDIFEFNNQLWLVGSISNRNDNDIWRSTDGINWHLVNSDFGYSNRNGFSVTTFKDKMWIHGGYDFTKDEYISEIWSSNDGITWTLETQDSLSTRRSWSTYTEFQGKLWLIGGHDINRNRPNDIWSSSDGINWKQESADAGFRGRSSGTQVNVVNNTLVMHGGIAALVDANDSDFPNDVWLSTDGINWHQQTDNAAYGPRKFFATAVHNEKLFVLQGKHPESDARISNNWKTPDGKTWYPVSDKLPRMMNIQALSHDQQLVILSGSIEYRVPKHDLWTSKSGYRWRSNPEASFPDSKYIAFHAFNNRLWANSAVNTHSSDDGVLWELANSTWPSGQKVQFNNKLWSIDTSSHAIYNTADGRTWEQVQSANNIPARTNARLVSYKNKLWLFGGIDINNKTINDIWSSNDGISWTQETTNSILNIQYVSQLIEYQGQLWAFSGDKIRYSQDGLNWSLATNTLPWFATYGYTILEHDNKLIALGGEGVDPAGSSTYIYSNEVWISENAIDWRKALAHELSF